MRCLILPGAVKPSITMILNEDILSFSFLKFFIFLHKKFYAFERIALNEATVFLMNASYLWFDFTGGLQVFPTPVGVFFVCNINSL